jgi:hypothetical protein
MNRRKLKYEEDIALSDTDIRNQLGGTCNIVVYPDLHNYASLDELMGVNNCAVILYESKPEYGHWTTVFKPNRDTVEFFNSYGSEPDANLKNIPEPFRHKSHQDYPYLSKLLLDSPYDLTYNPYKLQKKNNDVRTCGRHVVERLKNKNLPLTQYIDMLDDLCKYYHTDYDGVVTIETTPSG